MIFYRISAFIIIWTTLLFVGCDFNSTTFTDQNPEVEETRDDLQEMRQKLQEAAQILTEVSRDQDAIAVVRKAVRMRDERGHGENVSFTHLLRPDVEIIDKSYTNLGTSFSDAFARASAAIESKSGGNVDASSLVDYLTENGIVIHWPNHELFHGKTGTPTVTFHPLTEEAENSQDVEVIGFRPDLNKSLSSNEILVDESYTETNLTLVVAPCETYTKSDGNKMACIGEIDGGYNYQDPYSDPLTTSDGPLSSDDEFEVFLNEMQCREDTDSFLSGGPDYRVYIYEPNIVDFPLDPDAEGVVNYYQVNNFSGRDCDNKDWEKVGASWDPRWEKIDKENGFMVYDHDRFGGTTFEYEVGYEGEVFGVQVQGSVKGSFDINNNESLFNINIDRKSFASGNDTDCRDLGMRHSSCIRGGGSSLRFTLTPNKIE